MAVVVVAVVVVVVVVLIIVHLYRSQMLQLFFVVYLLGVSILLSVVINRIVSFLCFRY